MTEAYLFKINVLTKYILQMDNDNYFKIMKMSRAQIEWA